MTFDDSSWEYGPTPLGYKTTTGGMATSLGVGPVRILHLPGEAMIEFLK